MGRRVTIGGGLVALAALAGLVALLHHGRAAAEVAALTAAPEGAKPTAAQIVSLLEGDDFKAKALARRRIDELPGGERGAVLGSLARSSRAEVRLMAVSAVERAADRAPYRPLLSTLAASDPDPDVRSAAAQLLQEVR